MMSYEDVNMRLHFNHGKNITLEESSTVAIRNAGFDNGIVFSEQNLHAGELFVVEVEQNENDYCGSLRLGLTQVNPSIFSADDVELPEHGVPDLMALGSTWLYSLTELLPDIGDNRDILWPFDIDSSKIDVSEGYIRTCCGSYPRLGLRNLTNNTCDRWPYIEVGSKVGVGYIPTDEKYADLYYVLNGDVFGPYACEIPYRNCPLFAVVDVYGKTKRIRVLQMKAEKSLKQMCQRVILKTCDMKQVKKLHLPKSIIEYLNVNPSRPIF